MWARPLLCDFIISVACPVWNICLVTPEACYSPRTCLWHPGFEVGCSFPTRAPPSFCNHRQQIYLGESGRSPKNSFLIPLSLLQYSRSPRGTVLHWALDPLVLWLSGKETWLSWSSKHVEVLIKCTKSSMTANSLCSVKSSWITTQWLFG